MPDYKTNSPELLETVQELQKARPSDSMKLRNIILMLASSLANNKELGEKEVTRISIINNIIKIEDKNLSVMDIKPGTNHIEGMKVLMEVEI
jgi:hypothetical protein